MSGLLLVIGLLVLASTSQAAWLLDLTVGGSVWYTNPKGSANVFGYENDLDTALELDNEPEYHAYAEVQHFLPIIPDVRAQYTSLTIDGTNGTLTDPFGEDLPAGTTVDARLELDHFDIILFYTLPLPLVDIDLGLQGRYIEGRLEVSGEVALGDESIEATYSEGFTLPIPMGFARGRLNIPLTSLFVEAQAAGLSISGNTVFDGHGLVGYETDLGLGVAAGWRHQVWRLNDVISEVELDVEVGGPFASLFFHF